MIFYDNPNLYNNKLQDQLSYERIRRIYLNTNSEIIRHVMEGALVQLLRKGVRPCHNYRE